MSFSKEKRSTIRSFERKSRIEALLDAGFIDGAGEIPADAIPARVEFVERCRASLHCGNRPPYFRAQELSCADCGEPFTWTAGEQRFWYEQLDGSIYSKAVRCLSCRRRRREPAPKSLTTQ